MGCDIHLFVEKQNQAGAWEAADKWTANPYFKGDPESESPLTVEHRQRFYTGRNYNLFAILANVRNGRGFAGVDTGDGFNPIAPPRGLPSDVTEAVKRESDSWGCDGHSHSYFTLAELLAYDWTQVTKHRGFLNGPEYIEWQRMLDWESAPKSYCGVSGGSVRHVSASEMKRITDGIKAEAKAAMPNDWYPSYCDTVAKRLGDTYCQVEWTQAYYESCSSFWSETIPRLLRVGPHEGVRIVFWFDN